MRLPIHLILIISCLLFSPTDSILYAEDGYIDVHVHLDPMGLVQKKPFFTRGPRGPRQRGNKGIDYAEMADTIVTWMDKMKVEKAILMPPPQVPTQSHGKSTYATYLEAIKYSPERLVLGGGGGVLNPLIYQYGKNEVTPEVSQHFREEAEKLIRAGITVFGEMATLHLSMQEQHIFSQADPDHPLFLLLADIAAENNIPIDLHMEAIPKDIPTPQSILNISSRNPNTLKANIPGLERFLAHNRKAKIVWQHIGWDNIGYMTIELLTDLLQKHPNLYLALRVEARLMKKDKSGLMPNRIVNRDGDVHPQWFKFITDYADRIVIGSDDFMGLKRSQSRPKDSFAETWIILSQFPEEIAQKIGRDNAARIYNLR
ncbi:MAG: amidohydrolase [Candidatus Omnitrophica bacterium]|nr:amidohydrolase [Candidatus Omnitrophota bacterium]